jgi:Tol biopolymer transport system component
VIWNISTRQVVLTLNVPGGGGTVAFSPDGKSLAVVSSGGIAIYSLASLSA